MTRFGRYAPAHAQPRLIPPRPAASDEGRSHVQIPSLALAGFNFFQSEYSATRAELQAEMARRFPLQQRYAELAKSVLVTRGGSVLIETRPD